MKLFNLFKQKKEKTIDYSILEKEVRTYIDRHTPKYSMEIPKEPKENNGIKYSNRYEDNYDSVSTFLEMHKFVQKDIPNDGKYYQYSGLLFQNHKNMSFVDKMLSIIKERHLKDSQVYKAAQVDRRLYSKIISENGHNPSKDTCIALCLGMRLSLEETNELLFRAGYTLSHSISRDIAIEYFIVNKKYDINEINTVLERLNFKPLGR